MRKIVSLSLSLLLIIFAVFAFAPRVEANTDDVLVDVTIVDGDDATKIQFGGQLGESVAIDLSALDVEKFEFFIHQGSIVEDHTTEFVVSESNNIIAVFKTVDLVYIDTNGAFLGANTEPTVELSKPGYEFNAFVDHADNNIVQVATYTRTNEALINLNVTGGIVTPEAPVFNDVVTLEPTELTNFAYWADEDGQIVSTNPNYKFTAMKDLTLEAVHDETFTKEDVLYLTNVSGIREDHLSFLGHFDLLEGKEAVEYGLLASNEQEILTLDSETATKIPSTALTPNNEFLRSFAEDAFTTFRAYAIFDNGTELVTVYSDNNFAIVSTVTGDSHEQIFKFTSGNSSYETRTVMGVQGKNWVATDARTDQLIEEDRTITIRNGSLNTQFINGLSSLEFDYQKKYSDNNAYIEIHINGDLVGEKIVIENNTSPVHKYINEELIYEGEVNIEIKVNGRVAINNIIWKDYSKEELDTKLLEVEFVLDESSKERLIYGKVVEEPVEPSKVGFVFDGWFIDGTNEMYDFNTPITRHLKLVARFTPLEEFTVSFDLNGGIGNIDNQVVFEGETALEPADIPIHETLVFAGWTTTKDSEDYYDFETLIFDNITLYAKWVDESNIPEEFYNVDLRTQTVITGNSYRNNNDVEIFNDTLKGVKINVNSVAKPSGSAQGLNNNTDPLFFAVNNNSGDNSTEKAWIEINTTHETAIIEFKIYVGNNFKQHNGKSVLQIWNGTSWVDFEGGNFTNQIISPLTEYTIKIEGFNSSKFRLLFTGSGNNSNGGQFVVRNVALSKFSQ